MNLPAIQGVAQSLSGVLSGVFKPIRTHHSVTNWTLELQAHSAQPALSARLGYHGPALTCWFSGSFHRNRFSTLWGSAPCR